MPIKPRSAKAKGKNFERKIAKKIGDFFGCDTVRRTPCSGAIDDWPGDICRLPKEMEDYVIECKNQERTQIWDWLAQAEREAGRKTPILIFSRNRSPDYAVVRLDDLLNLIKESKHA